MTLTGGRADESRPCLLQVLLDSTVRAPSVWGTHRQVTQVHGLGLDVAQALGSCSLRKLLQAPGMHVCGYKGALHQRC